MALKGLEWMFDTVPSTYEKFRPGYVKELYQTLFDYIPINENSNVVEVGSGGGQATAPILMTECRFMAVEYGEQFSELLKDKFKEYHNFSVITGRFEDTVFEQNAFDLVFSASAFHWVPEKAGYEKVFSMLKSGGAFARFANYPYLAKGNPALSQELEEVYDQYYNKYYNKERETISEFTEQQAKERALIAGKYGFSDIRYELFYRERVFSAKEYIELLGTYSDHIAIEKNIRTEFFAKIEEVIHKHGDMITIYDNMRATGQRIRKIMNPRKLTVKDVQSYLNLASVQSIYHWLNGQSMPTVDNLYALSELFRLPVDVMLVGDRKYHMLLPNELFYSRMYVYHMAVKELKV